MKQVLPTRRFIVSIVGQNNTDHRMVTAHLDTLGAMVKGIKEDGRLIIEKIGGFSTIINRRGKLSYSLKS